MDLADVAAELYSLLPADFTAARNRRAKDAKSEGHPLLAKQVARLPKPTASAWAVNLVARQHPEQLAPVLELGAALRDAQEMLDAERLRELGQRRSRVLAEAVRGARSAAEGLGVRITDAAATEIEQTLRAAMGDSDAAAAVSSGLLVRTFAGGGFGPADLSGAVAVPGAVADERDDSKAQKVGKEKAATRDPAAEETAEETAVGAEAQKDTAKAEAAEARRLEAEEAEARREAQRQAEAAKRRERDEAQAELAEAEEALSAAEAELEDAERQAEDAAGRRESIEGELAGLRARAAELEDDLAVAEREEGLAARARRLAARVMEQERRAVARAREHVDRLS